MKEHPIFTPPQPRPRPAGEDVDDLIFGPEETPPVSSR